jgi:hypothetical protein
VKVCGIREEGGGGGGGAPCAPGVIDITGLDPSALSALNNSRAKSVPETDCFVSSSWETSGQKLVIHHSHADSISFGVSTPVATGISATKSDGRDLSSAETTFEFASIEAPRPKANALRDDEATSLVAGEFESKSGDELITTLWTRPSARFF